MILRNLSELPALLGRNQCLLGLDYGSKVIGVAVSDPNLRIASPIASIVRRKFAQDAAQMIALMREREIGGIIVGWPKNMDGSDGATAQAARAFVRNLSQYSDWPKPDLPVVFWDERLSTAAVERFLIAGDMSRKRRDEVIDKAAAAYILQGALDALQHGRSADRRD
ncbi:MAG: Holliday junction resolvase RuvX [Alphaproteobacteria bacterium]|nr:Holliday junction resolvase RuvX [Alphaproteobacteria bacterium]